MCRDSRCSVLRPTRYHALNERGSGAGQRRLNAMLASGGCPWPVIRVEDRNAYLAALDRASIDMKIEPFRGVHRGTDAVVDEAGGCKSAPVVNDTGAGYVSWMYLSNR